MIVASLHQVTIYSYGEAKMAVMSAGVLILVVTTCCLRHAYGYAGLRSCLASLSLAIMSVVSSCVAEPVSFYPWSPPSVLLSVFSGYLGILCVIVDRLACADVLLFMCPGLSGGGLFGPAGKCAFGVYAGHIVYIRLLAAVVFTFVFVCLLLSLRWFVVVQV